MARALYGVSLLGHVALAGLVASLRPPAPRAVAQAVEIVEAPPAAAPEPPPPAPAEVAPVAAAATAPPKAKMAAAPAAKAAAPAPAAEAAPTGGEPLDLGFALAGGSGGLAVAQGNGGKGGVAAARPATAPKVLTAPPRDACEEPATKARPVEVPTPSFPDEARSAGVAGKVRVEVTVGETGRVEGARVLQGLGHGLDEAALAAARGARFEPGLRCGRPARTTFVFAIRFDR